MSGEVDAEDVAYAEGLEDGLLDATMAEFVDEPPMDHNTYPESEEEDEDGVSRWSIQPVNRSEENLYIRQVFFNREMFCEAVLNHALSSGRNLKQNRYDKEKIGFNCIGQNCQWRVYCGKKSESDQWEIRRLNDTHSCVPNGDCKMLKVPVIMRLFIHQIREDPKQYMPMKIKALIKAQWNITVSRAHCQFARLKALKLIEIEYDRQFSRIRDYGAEILHANPDSNVVIETLRNDDGMDVFNRLYICLDVVRKSWLKTCRKVIGLDGCFLKGKMKGQLLVAIGRDENNCIYPIAWAIVQVEDTSNWTWFVKKLQDDFRLGDGDGFVLLSDRQKGLINAVETELPKIEHRMCVRHIYANLKAKFGKKPLMKPLIWTLAWSYTETSYTQNLEKLRLYNRAVYKYVIDSDPKHCSYEVRLGTRSCTFRKWDIRGVPCEHAYAVVLAKKGEVENYVEHWFRTDVWRRAYIDGIAPTRGAVFWPRGTCPDVHCPGSPPQPGRKKRPNPEKKEGS